MIARVVRSVALFVVVWPAGAGAAGNPLRAIDHISPTQTICANVVVHANAAIDSRNKADDALAAAIVRLRSNAFDDDLSQRGIVSDVVRFAATLADSSARGSAESKRLAAIAENDSHHASDLRTFALSLDRTFEFDRQISTLLASLPGTLQVRALRENSGGIASRSDANGRTEFGRGTIRSSDSDIVRLPAPARTSAPNAFARAIAAEIESGLKAVSNDESRAAAVVESAVTGC